MQIGSREFDVGHHTYIMGILNVTPDSFSDGGKFIGLDDALFHVEKMVREGMDILDIGGESARPGYTPLSEGEEISRVVPVIEAVKSRFDVPISLDTNKPGVARAGLAAGIDLVNDIWGLKADPDMAKVIAEGEVPCVLMHNRRDADYQVFPEGVVEDLKETLVIAEKNGIARDKIILDPGIGFGKTCEQNLIMINSLEILRELNCPVLLGCSRKSVIGLTLGLPVSERVEGTIVTTVFGVIKGCSFVRVHDIRENVRAVKMTEAILSSGGGFIRT